MGPVEGAAHAARVLRPGGRLAKCWNVFETPPVMREAFASALRRVAPDSPCNLPTRPSQARDICQKNLAKVADGVRESGRFGNPEQWRFDREHTYRRDEWLDQLPTTRTTVGKEPTQERSSRHGNTGIGETLGVGTGMVGYADR